MACLADLARPISSVSYGTAGTSSSTSCNKSRVNAVSAKLSLHCFGQSVKAVAVFKVEEVRRHGRIGIGSVRASVKPEAETEDQETKKVEKGDVKLDLEKDISKVVRKTAATFAPRASTARNKNPAQPGTVLYSIFEVQAYVSMLVGGVLSFNLLFPSDHPDIWRLMGMWSVWMFTIPSLRARDCSGKEKEALNYLFLAIPLINVSLPLVWKSFAAVWLADVIAFFAMYAWKLQWLGGSDNKNSSDQ